MDNLILRSAWRSELSALEKLNRSFYRGHWPEYRAERKRVNQKFTASLKALKENTDE